MYDSGNVPLSPLYSIHQMLFIVYAATFVIGVAASTAQTAQDTTTVLTMLFFDATNLLTLFYSFGN
jgi:NADH:ubiquinone oxidoreductase subunit 3 (subunit A)